ncbi:Tigger transposable element-derived protein 1 [Dictyocoela muelleri]|nr:Tigger transposable element-derived protein 1 [Dictyocoela muelleri]
MVKIIVSQIYRFFLPPATTSKIQPLDQGIIRSFKSKYRKFLSGNILFNEDYDTECYTKILKNLKLSDIISTIIESWNSVFEDTIINCFKRAFKNLTNDITELKTANEIKIDVQKEVNFDSEYINTSICLTDNQGENDILNAIYDVCGDIEESFFGERRPK